ncbi:MAG: hypothetical protein ACRDJU_00950 [Actinomycetota bacterium]
MTPDPAGARPARAGSPGWPGRVAVGVLRGEPPQVFLAANDAVLGRLLALRVVAAADPGDLGDDATREIREALVEERWADAVETWMAATGEVVDGYPDEQVVTEAMLDGDRASMEIRLAPIFRDPPAEAPATNERAGSGR